MRHAKRTDENQKSIVNELRSYGFTVDITSNIGNGFPDAIVSKNHRAIGVEIKNIGKRKQLTDKEIKFRCLWVDLGMTYIVAETTKEILYEFKKMNRLKDILSDVKK